MPGASDRPGPPASGDPRPDPSDPSDPSGSRSDPPGPRPDPDRAPDRAPDRDSGPGAGRRPDPGTGDAPGPEPDDAPHGRRPGAPYRTPRQEIPEEVPGEPREAPGAPPGFPESLWAHIIRGTSAGIAVFDTHLRFLYVNPALEEINGVPLHSHIGRHIDQIVPDVDYRPDVLRAVLADGRPRTSVFSGHTPADDGTGSEPRFWNGVSHRLEDEHGDAVGVVVVILEVSDEWRARQELERAQQRLLLMDAAAARIGTTLEMDRTCQELADLLRETIADVVTVEVFPVHQAGAVGVRPPPDGVVRLRRAAMSASPALRPHAPVFGEPGELVDYQRGSAIPRCLETGRPVVANHLTDARITQTAPNSERIAGYRAAGIHSGLIIPLAARGEQLGTVSMVRAGASPPFDEDDTATAQTLARRAAIALDNARRFTREHGIAVELQRALLVEPHAPHPDLEVATRYLPAGEADLVGGDWFDTVPLAGGRTLLALGDVMGHGLEAAVEMSRYRTVLRMAAGPGLPPHRVLERMDALLQRAEAERPCTCLLALVDPAAGVCSYASAGHLPPAVVARDGRVRLRRVPPGPPLGTGLFGGRHPEAFSTVSGPWEAGGTLLMYTDGLVERRGEAIDASLARLGALRLPPDAPLDGLLGEVVERLAPRPMDDDLAVLAARLRP